MSILVMLLRTLTPGTALTNQSMQNMERHMHSPCMQHQQGTHTGKTDGVPLAGLINSYKLALDIMVAFFLHVTLKCRSYVHTLSMAALHIAINLSEW